MSIDWSAFTPWPALAGGAIIGIAAATFVLLNGRIAGISGIVGGLLKPAKGDAGWRVAFVLGLAGAPLVYALFAALPRPQIDAGYLALVEAKALVFVAAMLAGMAIFELLEHRNGGPPTGSVNHVNRRKGLLP